MDKKEIALKIAVAGTLMIGSYLLGKHGKTIGKEAYEGILKAAGKMKEV